MGEEKTAKTWTIKRWMVITGAVVILIIGLVLPQACGGHPSELVGTWVTTETGDGSVSSYLLHSMGRTREKLYLTRSGQGVLSTLDFWRNGYGNGSDPENIKINWQAGDGTLCITHGFNANAVVTQYTVSGNILTLSNERGTVTYKKQ